MAKIESYVLANAPLSGSDKLIGTDTAHDNATKNFSINELITFITNTDTYVPYTGATGNVDLGSNDLSVGTINILGELISNGSAGTSGRVLTSQGSGLPAVWQFPTVSTTLQDVLNNGHALTNEQNFQGTTAGSGSTGSNINAFGIGAAANNSNKDNINAFGYYAAVNNSGSNVNAFGYQAGVSNAIDGVTMFSNYTIPSYLNFAAASAAISVGTGASAGTTYLYHDQTTNSIGAVRIP